MVLHVTKLAFEIPSLSHADTVSGFPARDKPDPMRPSNPTLRFAWSVSSMIPTSPDMVLGIWQGVNGFEFKIAYGLLGTLKDKG